MGTSKGADPHFTSLNHVVLPIWFLHGGKNYTVLSTSVAAAQAACWMGKCHQSRAGSLVLPGSVQQRCADIRKKEEKMAQKVFHFSTGTALPRFLAVQNFWNRSAPTEE